MKKLLSITLAVTTIAWLAGSFVFIPVANAAVIDGDIVSATTTFIDADGNTYYPYDVFIVKIVGSKTFKRLILNPQVFTSYEHLKWSNLKKLSADTVKGYTISALTRAINDTRVYVLAPNGDTGTKQWVDDLTCFNSKSYDWDSVYIINATDRDNYSTIGSLCGTGGGVTGNLMLSLASDNPVAATLPPNAQGVTFAKYNLTGSGTINQITFKRIGAGSVEDFGDIFVYKEGVRLTSGRALSSSTSAVTFINLGLTAPTTFDLVADISTGQAGNVNYFSIETASSVTANATIGGTFPMNSNPMGMSATSAGTLTVTKAGATSRNVTIGGTNQEISQFKVDVATEGTNIKRIKLINGGDADNDKIINLKLKDNLGNTLATATSVSASGYADFVLATPFYIKKGESQIFHVYADIGATRPERTIKLYLELATDILGVGTTYGFGMAATISGFDSTTSGEAVQVTCKGGDLTLNKIGPNATTIGTTTSDTVFLEYTVAAAADITIKRTRLVFCEDIGGDGYNAYASYSAGASNDLEDIKVKEKDSGVVVIGPKEGTAFNDGLQASVCGGVAGIYEEFTDTIDLTAGTTKTYQITADIKTSNTGATRDTASGDKIKFILYSYATLVNGSGTTGNVNYMKYAGTSDAVYGSAIAPSGDIAGEEMTLGAASLALTVAASPSGGDATNDEKVYVKGQNGVTAVGIVFTAGTASDITVNSIQLISYILEATTGTFAAGKDENYVKDSIGNVYIYDKDTGALVPGSSAKGFTSGTNSEYVDYSGLAWTIPAGTSKTLLVKSDISSAAPASGSGTVDTWIAFDIEDADADVTAIDADGNSVDTVNNLPNGTGTTVNFGIVDYGTLAIDQATDTPYKNLLVMGSADNEVSKFKLSGTYESWYLKTFSIVLDDGQGIDTEDRDNFSAIKIKYQTQSQWGTSNWTVSSGKSFANTASLAFSFTGDNRIYVPKDDSSYVTVLASIADYSGGMGAKSKVPFKIYDTDGSTSSLEANGAQSGKQLTTYSTDNAVAADFNLQFVVRSKPVFAKVATTATNELARFTITAVGYDVIFDGVTNDLGDDITSACLRFDVIASTNDANTLNFYLYDWNEVVLASREAQAYVAGQGYNGTLTSISFEFEENDATVPAGLTKEFHIDLAAADVYDFVETDESIYLQLRNDDGGVLATGSMNFGGRDIVWHDGTNEEGISGQSDPESRFGMPSLIKNIGIIPITFTQIRGTTTATQ
jgi:hypothetical protein